MTDITITDRSSWLAYRADWRLRYAEASEDVRSVKRSMREAVDLRRGGASESEIDRIDHSLMPSYQSRRELHRVRARLLMKELDDAKEQKNSLLHAEERPAIAA